MFTETKQEPLAETGSQNLESAENESDEYDSPFIKNSQTHFANQTWIKYVFIITLIIAALAIIDAIFLL